MNRRVFDRDQAEILVGLIAARLISVHQFYMALVADRNPDQMKFPVGTGPRPIHMQCDLRERLPVGSFLHHGSYLLALPRALYWMYYLTRPARLLFLHGPRLVQRGLEPAN